MCRLESFTCHCCQTFGPTHLHSFVDEPTTTTDKYAKLHAHHVDLFRSVVLEFIETVIESLDPSNHHDHSSMTGVVTGMLMEAATASATVTSPVHATSGENGRLPGGLGVVGGGQTGGMAGDYGHSRRRDRLSAGQPSSTTLIHPTDRTDSSILISIEHIIWFLKSCETHEVRTILLLKYVPPVFCSC
jgi:hypothetical protein